MKRMKLGLIAMVIALLALTVAVVGAQPPAGNGNGGGFGRGLDLQVIAETLGIDVQTLQTDLQNGQTIAEVAAAQKIDVSTIIDVVVAKRTEQLTQAVTDGTLTQEQADAQIVLLKANLNAELTKSLTAPVGTPTAPDQTQPPQRGTDVLTTIATALGIDADTLKSDLQSGKTIEAVASEKGVDLSTVTDAVVAARTAELAQEVTDGRLTQEQADAQILVLKADLNASYSKTFDAQSPINISSDFGGQMPPDGNGGPGGNPPNGNPPDGNGNGSNPPNGQPANPPAGNG